MKPRSAITQESIEGVNIRTRRPEKIPPCTDKCIERDVPLFEVVAGAADDVAAELSGAIVADAPALLPTGD